MKAFHRIFASCALCGVFSLILTSCGNNKFLAPYIARVEAAQNAYDTALHEEATAEQTLSDAIRIRDDDAAALTAAKASRSILESNINTAITDQQAGEALYQQRRNETSDAQAALEQIKEDQKEPRKYENSSLGFFLWNTEDSGSDIETIKKYMLGQVSGSQEAKPNLSSTTDAASYKNFKDSIAWIEKCNEMRQRENQSEGTNLQPLGITDEAMFVAVLHADYSSNVLGHHAQTTGCDYRGSFGENLAWGRLNGGDGPFSMWYTAEKPNYQQTPVWNNTTGHYLNIVNKNYTVTGFAIQSATPTYSYTYAQEFSRYTHGCKAYTVAQYRARISAYDSYLNQLESTLTSAKRAVTSAQTAEQNAQSNLIRLEQNVSNAKKAQQDNETKIATLTEKSPQNELDIEAAQADLSEKQATVIRTKQELDDATQALEDVQNNASSKAA